MGRYLRIRSRALPDRVLVAGFREAPDPPRAVLLIGALFLARYAPGAKEATERQAFLPVGQQTLLVQPARRLDGADLVTPFLFEAFLQVKVDRVKVGHWILNAGLRGAR